jgi:ribosomal protein L35
MPKMKSKSAVSKRFRITKNGKAVCSHHDRGHGHSPFGGKTSRNLRRPLVMNSAWSKLIKKMLGK